MLSAGNWPVAMVTREDILTPADEEEHPLAEFVGGVGHDDGRVKITALHEHPEEIRHHKIVIDGGYEATPWLGRERENNRISINNIVRIC